MTTLQASLHAADRSVAPPPLRGVVAPLRRRDLARRREPCYRGPWRLPGPDSHRLAAVSLSLGYASVFLLSLGARTTGRTKGAETRDHAAALEYSWMRPASKSRRRTRPGWEQLAACQFGPFGVASRSPRPGSHSNTPHPVPRHAGGQARAPRPPALSIGPYLRTWSLVEPATLRRRRAAHAAPARAALGPSAPRWLAEMRRERLHLTAVSTPVADRPDIGRGAGRDVREAVGAAFHVSGEGDPPALLVPVFDEPFPASVAHGPRVPPGGGPAATGPHPCR